MGNSACFHFCRFYPEDQSVADLAKAALVCVCVVSEHKSVHVFSGGGGKERKGKEWRDG